MASGATVGILRVLLTANTAEFDTAMKRVSSAAGALSKDLGKMGQQATQLGASLTRSLTVPLLGLGVGAAKLAMDFESSFAGVRKTVKATEPEFAEMAQAFRNLSKEIPVNVNELNRLGEAAGALGIPKAEIVDFSRVMALLGVTTNLTSDMAAEGIAKIQNIFGAAGKDTERFASTLVALGNDGASTEDQILSMATRIAGAGNAVGMTQGQVLAFASALSSVGIEAEMGGSAISRVFIDIASAVSQGGDAVSGFAQTAGMSIDQFSTKFKTDAAGAVNDFIVGLSKVKESGGDLIGTLQELGFTEIRVRDTLLRAAGAGDLLTRALNLQAEAWQKNEALMAEARERFKTTESQLTLLWNRIKDVGITLGNALLPTIQLTVKALGDLIPVIDSLARGFNAMPTSIQAIVVGLGLAVAAAGPLLFVFGQLLTSASLVTGAFAAKGLAAKALGVALTALSAPVIAIGAAIGGLAVIWANFKDDWVRAFDILIPPLGLFRTGLDAVQRALAPHLPLIKDLASIVRSLFVIAWQEASRVLTHIKDSVLVPLRTEWNLWNIAISDVAGTLTNLLMPVIRSMLPGMLLLVDMNQRLGRESATAKLAVRLLAEDLGKAAGSYDKTTDSTKKTTTAQQENTQVYQQAAGPPAELAKTHRGLSEQLKKTMAQVAALSTEQRKAIVDGDKLGHSAKEISAELNKQWPALNITEAAVKLYTDSLKGAGRAAKAAVKDLTEFKEALDKLSGRSLIEEGRKLEAQLRAIGGSGNILIAQLPALSQGFKDAASAARAVGDVLLAQHFEELAAATNPLNEALKRAGVNLKDVSGQMIDTVQPARDADAMIDQFMSSVVDANGVVTRFAGSSLPELVRQLELLGTIDPGFEMDQTIFSALIPGSVIDTSGVQTGGRFGKAMMGGLQDALANMGPTILQALTGGGNVLQSIGSLFGQSLGTSLVEGFGKNIIGALGKTLGGVFNSLIPGLGALLGPLLGKIGDFFKGMFGVSKEVKQARTELDAFQKKLMEAATAAQKNESGGRAWALTLIQVRDAFLKVGRSAEEAERLVAQLLNTDNPEAMRRAMEEINEVLEEQQRILEENTQEANDLFDEIMQAGSEGIPAAFQPAIEQLISLGLLTDEQAERLRGLGEAGTVNVEKMEEAMGVLQGRIESLGPAFQQAKLDQTSKKYVDAIDQLIKGGADVGGVLFDAREELSALAVESLRTGRTLPANMKPWIEELHRAGLLVDENGERLQDLAGIQYGEEMKSEAQIAEEGWNRIIDRIEDLIEIIAGPLERSLDDVTRDRTIKINVDAPDIPPWLENPDLTTQPAAMTSSAFNPPNMASLRAGALSGVASASALSLPTTTTLASSREQLVILAPVLMQPGSDTDGVVDEVFRQLPSGVAINRHNVRVAFKQVFADGV